MLYLIFVIVSIVCFAVLALAAWRFFVLRPHGISVVMRTMNGPWRHGVISYSDELLKFYKLRSLSPRVDIQLVRNRTELVGRRERRDDECSTLEDGLRILAIKSNAKEYEIAFDLRGETAFTSWLESAPTARAQRLDVRTAMKHLNQSY